MNKKYLKMFAAAAALVAIVLIIRTVYTPAVTVDSGYRQVMGTLARIVVVAADNKTAQDAVDSAFEQLYLVDEIMSFHNSGSQLSLVNQKAFDEPVAVDESLFEVLCIAVDYSKKTDGAFDVTIGPVMDLWQQAGKEQRTPSEEEIAQAKSKVGSDKLILDAQNKTVKFSVPGMKLDLGGIAKGWAVDKAVETLRQKNVSAAMVDLGGNIRCFGAPPGKDYWTIGLQNPTGDEGIVLTLKLSDVAVATSGDYRRFVVIAGQKHSHIINPMTADSAMDFSSVTVIAPRAVDADALSTAVTVLGKDKGLALIESTPNTEAILILPDNPNEFIKSSAAAGFVVE